MTQPTTRTTFKDYCKRKLGWPVVELNIDDDQVEDCIDDGLQFFQEYHFDATEVTYLKHQITGSTLKLASSPTGDFSNGELFTGGTSGVRATVHAYHSANTTLRYKDPKVKSGGDGNTYYANTTTTFSTGETLTGSTSGATATTHASTATAFGDYDKKYVTIAESIIGIRRVIPFYDNFGSSSMFSVKYQFALNELYRLGSGLATYEISQQHLRMIDEMFTGRTLFRYTRHADRLYLEISWGSDVDIDDWIVVECDQILDPATYSDVWSDLFLKKYSTALIKKQWGQNLIKFEGLQLPGGITLNGRQMYDDATAELERIEEEMQVKYELPVDFSVG
ncbi:hypothetical protein HX837_07675 [Marine Group I thaumarchaeote]|uniref:Neck protein n=1 Tax=Marine Group I thaumarchaeote TaxID=2511932 RepID=A0A7K4MR87_9ARCH|nr:hypothetical protein [Marine Group I thaumarchaeote]